MLILCSFDSVLCQEYFVRFKAKNELTIILDFLPQSCVLKNNNYRLAHWHIRHQSDDEQAIKKLQPNCTENPPLGFWYVPFVKLSVVWGLPDVSTKEKNYLVYSRMQKRSLACVWGRWILSVRTKLYSDICNNKYGGCAFSDISHFLLILNQYLARFFIWRISWSRRPRETMFLKNIFSVFSFCYFVFSNVVFIL